MRLLVDLLHPAHVHFFREAVRELRGRGHEVVLTARDKDVALPLLDRLGLEHRLLGRQRSGAAGLAGEWLSRSCRLALLARRIKPDLLMGIMGVSIAPVGRLLGIPTVVFYDTENAVLSNRVVFPLASAVVTPDCFAAPVRGRHFTYPGYHELSYLHPSRFRPDPAVLKELGVEPGERFFVVRFVSWKASHDWGQSGFSLEGREALIDLLRGHGKVFISSEEPLEGKHRALALPISVERVHSVLAYAHLCVGESATMASEAAVLGTPAVYHSPVGRGYTDEQERRYGLCFTFRDERKALEKIRWLVGSPNLKVEWQRRRETMLRDKCDVTAWICRFLEEFLR
jgi:predicted glycosyltransferase